MKKLRTTSDVFHAWAHQSYPSAECSSVSFRGPELFSYEACIAKLLPNNAVVHTTQTHTKTTSDHQSQARRATHHMKRVYCHDPSKPVNWNLLHVKGVVECKLLSIPAPVLKKDGTETVLSKKRREDIKLECLRRIEQANEYLKYSGDTETKPLELGDLEKFRGQLLVQEQERKKAEEEAKKRRAEEELEDLEKWRNHEPVQRRFHGTAPALRLSKSGEEIETSWGARIPTGDAKKLWFTIVRNKRVGLSTVFSGSDVVMLGNYQLNEVRGDGSIKVGCHDIAYSELELMAKKLGLVKETQNG